MSPAGAGGCALTPAARGSSRQAPTASHPSRRPRAWPASLASGVRKGSAPRPAECARLAMQNGLSSPQMAWVDLASLTGRCLAMVLPLSITSPPLPLMLNSAGSGRACLLPLLSPAEIEDCGILPCAPRDCQVRSRGSWNYPIQPPRQLRAAAGRLTIEAPPIERWADEAPDNRASCRGHLARVTDERMHATDADNMTPQQRLEEIADILAGGFLRLRRRPGHVPEAEHGGSHSAENTFQDSQELPGAVAAASA